MFWALPMPTQTLETLVFSPNTLLRASSCCEIACSNICLAFISVMTLIPHKTLFFTLGVLASAGTSVIVLTPPAVGILRPIWVSALHEENWARAVVVGLLVGDSHPLLPGLGYAFYGATFGLAYTVGVSKTQFMGWGIFGGCLFLLMGIRGYLLHGPPSLDVF